LHEYTHAKPPQIFQNGQVLWMKNNWFEENFTKDDMLGPSSFPHSSSRDSWLIFYFFLVTTHGLFSKRLSFGLVLR